MSSLGYKGTLRAGGVYVRFRPLADITRHKVSFCFSCLAVLIIDGSNLTFRLCQLSGEAGHMCHPVAGRSKKISKDAIAEEERGAKHSMH